ncbi:MAG: thioredoxin [Thaumarchaeota archaeon]|nr:thioredoxin [Nitrososphaerota archaeon]
MMTGSGSSGLKEQSNGSVVLTSANFNQIIGGEKPVVVDFWAEWCGPCRYMHPIFEYLASKYAGKVVFGRLNVDENQEIAARYEVFSIPTFVIFKSGAQLDRVIGAVGEKGLESFVSGYM